MPDSIKCSKCDQEFTDEEAHKVHMNIDHGASEADLIQLSDDYSVPNGIGGYNPNPNSDFYNNKIFRKGSSTERTSILGEAKAIEGNFWCEHIGIGGIKCGEPRFDHENGTITDHEFYNGDTVTEVNSESYASEYNDVEIGFWWDSLPLSEKVSLQNQYGSTLMKRVDLRKTWKEMQNDGDWETMLDLNGVYANKVINRQTGISEDELTYDQWDPMSGQMSGIPANAWILNPNTQEWNDNYGHLKESYAREDNNKYKK